MAGVVAPSAAGEPAATDRSRQARESSRRARRGGKRGRTSRSQSGGIRPVVFGRLQATMTSHHRHQPAGVNRVRQCCVGAGAARSSLGSHDARPAAVAGANHRRQAPGLPSAALASERPAAPGPSPVAGLEQLGAGGRLGQRWSHRGRVLVGVGEQPASSRARCPVSALGAGRITTPSGGWLEPEKGHSFRMEPLPIDPAPGGLFSG